MERASPARLPDASKRNRLCALVVAAWRFATAMSGLCSKIADSRLIGIAGGHCKRRSGKRDKGEAFQ
ncbi:MAG: hypothetical protein ACUVQ6_02190 [Dissulfurimicrobium sp.]|uniref:hypothetical protein n=1 Tax=Dissulfurimicrobium sp. TaxID=2022436 RepID=UPI00404B9960